MNMIQTALTSRLDAAGAVLRIGGVGLLFPQSEIRTLEAASDVDVHEPLQGSVGWINFTRQRWPVYCLSAQLALQAEVPPERRTCALFALHQGYLGVLCDDVAIVKPGSAMRHELPLAMRPAHTPIQALLVHEERMLCVSNAQLLADYLQHLLAGGQQ